MRLNKKVLVGTFFGAALALVAACAGDGPTAPDESHPAIPQLAYSFDNCAVWSCSSGQCERDPAVWGACCLATADEPGTAQPRPSCEAPPLPNTDWCVYSSPRLSCLNKPVKPGQYPQMNCYELPLSGDAGEYFPECGGDGIPG